MKNTTVNTLNQARKLAQLTLSDLTISELSIVKVTIKSIKDNLDNGIDEGDIKVALDIIETSLNATDSSLNDFAEWEIADLLDKVLGLSDDEHLELPCGEVRVIYQDSIDKIWAESLIEQIKECYDLSDVPSFVEINWEKTAKNCKVDGLGHHFSSYDGEEHSTETHYIFRTN